MPKLDIKPRSPIWCHIGIYISTSQWFTSTISIKLKNLQTSISKYLRYSKLHILFECGKYLLYTIPTRFNHIGKGVGIGQVARKKKNKTGGQEVGKQKGEDT